MTYTWAAPLEKPTPPVDSNSPLTQLPRPSGTLSFLEPGLFYNSWRRAHFVVDEDFILHAFPSESATTCVAAGGDKTTHSLALSFPSTCLKCSPCTYLKRPCPLRALRRRCRSLHHCGAGSYVVTARTTCETGVPALLTLMPSLTFRADKLDAIRRHLHAASDATGVISASVQHWLQVKIGLFSFMAARCAQL